MKAFLIGVALGLMSPLIAVAAAIVAMAIVAAFACQWVWTGGENSADGEPVLRLGPGGDFVDTELWRE